MQRQRFPEVLFAPDACGLQVVDAETADDRYQNRSGIVNRRRGCLLPANERFLDHVLRVCPASEHSVRNREQQFPILFENVRGGCSFFFHRWFLA